MAFTEQNKVDIRFFLGYPDVYRQSNPRLENAIDIMGSRPETQNKVEMLLARLNTIYGIDPNDPGSINKAINAAGISKVVDAFGETVEYGNTAASKKGSASSSILNDINAYGRQLAGALSSFFGTPIASNVFGTYGYVGDAWKSGNKQSINYLAGYTVF